MRSAKRSADLLLWMLLIISILLLFPPAIHADNQVMGEIQFHGRSKVEKTSGVWVDGQYVGYLKELKGSKKVLLLPGEHVIAVRQNGYQDFTEHVVLEPGQKQLVRVAMEKAPTGEMPAVLAEVKISVNPSRAAVFLDGRFVGHVGEFEGVGRGLEIAPGAHKIRIALPGYQTFETEIDPLGNQKVEVKTDLVKNDAAAADPMLQPEGNEVPPPPPPLPANGAGPPQR
jgi:hypothetical protein